MGYIKYSGDNKKFAFHFSNIFGGGWAEEVKRIIELKINPEKIESKIYKTGWHSSDEEIIFSKDDIEVIIHFDEYDSIDIYTKDEKCSFEQIELWVKIINNETEIINKEKN